MHHFSPFRRGQQRRSTRHDSMPVHMLLRSSIVPATDIVGIVLLICIALK